MKNISFIILFIISCDETDSDLGANFYSCNSSLTCNQVQTCCDGLLYPTACCDKNCDDEIGTCED